VIKKLCFSARGSYFLFNEKELFGHGNAVAVQQNSNQIVSLRAAPSSVVDNRIATDSGRFKIFVP
jgi:hypothetical protein